MAQSDSFAKQVLPGLALLGAAGVGMALANSPASTAFFDALATKVGPVLGPISLHKSVLHWINDGLMAVFFLLVGLELKRELIDGALAKRRDAMLPAMAAIGGMAVPAMIYVAFHLGSPETMKGWAIPAATDIAFALCVLSLAGPRVPIGLRVFLVTVAVVDDLGAILIIALFYSGALNATALLAAAGLTIGLFAMRRFGVKSVIPYLLIGMLLWVAVLKSGIHATLAGVVTALAIPHDRDATGESALTHLEHLLHPWVSFLVLPIFGLANAGVPLAGMGLDVALGAVPMAIAIALVVGKPVGIIGMTWVAVKSGMCSLPAGVNWKGVLGASFAAGIGFTMSLFIGMLAFTDPAITAGVRIGVLIGSFISAFIALAVLRTLPLPGAAAKPEARRAPNEPAAGSLA